MYCILRISRERLAFTAAKADNTDVRVAVMFVEDEKVSSTTFKSVIQSMRANNVLHAILIVKGSLTSTVRSIMDALDTYRLEVFREQDLVINITEHDLVPRHEVLSKEAKRNLLDRYKVKDSQLPRIQYRDPVALYYGLQRGDVVRIIRRSETAGRYVTYRVCV